MIKTKLGQRLKELRQKTSLSQEDFANSIDMDRTYYASIESGKRNVSLINLEKLAKGFKISLSELFEGIK